MTTEAIPDPEALRLQLAAIGGNEPPSSYLELRPLTKDGRPAVAQRAFLPVRDVHSAAERITELARHFHVYVGGAPRVREDGSVAAIERVWCLWVDCDEPESVEALRRFRPWPSVVVQTSPGRLQAWWPLRAPLPPAWAKRSNQRLARALAADRHAVDAARVMRPVGSLNHKSDPPAPVICKRLELDVYLARDVVGHLPDPEAYGTRTLPAVHNGSAPASLDGLARKVRDARPPLFGKPGERNALLYWAACRLREHVDAGALDEDEGRGVLRQAALGAGLDELEIERTLESALGRRAAA